MELRSRDLITTDSAHHCFETLFRQPAHLRQSVLKRDRLTHGTTVANLELGGGQKTICDGESRRRCKSVLQTKGRGSFPSIFGIFLSIQLGKSKQTDNVGRGATIEATTPLQLPTGGGGEKNDVVLHQCGGVIRNAGSSIKSYIQAKRDSSNRRVPNSVVMNNELIHRLAPLRIADESFV
ncbi:hypothetical protein NDA13_000825 [Ustilago tritici]|nr:hypothetical protein NDA13_000825 [Ustilago tritici]